MFTLGCGDDIDVCLKNICSKFSMALVVTGSICHKLGIAFVASLQRIALLSQLEDCGSL